MLILTAVQLYLGIQQSFLTFSFFIEENHLGIVNWGNSPFLISKMRVSLEEEKGKVERTRIIAPNNYPGLFLVSEDIYKEITENWKEATRKLKNFLISIGRDYPLPLTVSPGSILVSYEIKGISWKDIEKIEIVVHDGSGYLTFRRKLY